VGYRHSPDEILAGAVTVALESGMAALTFARVGAELGISDRTVVYYFPTKRDLVLAVVDALAADVIALLEAAFGSDPLSPDDLVARAWPVLTTPDADRVFALYFEIVGLAASQTSPYDEVAPALLEAWISWLTPRVVGRTPEVRRRRALATVARVDGFLLVRQVLGAEAAEAAVRGDRSRA